MGKNVNVMIPAILPEDVPDRICQTEGLPIEKALPKVTALLLRDYAGGGIMLDPTSATRICQALARQDPSPSDIAKAVDLSANRDGRNLVVRYVVEESRMEQARDLCLAQLGDLNENGELVVSDEALQLFFQRTIDAVFDNNLLYDLPPIRGHMRFNETQMDELRDILGSEPGADDMVALIRGAKKVLDDAKALEESGGVVRA